ncbi:methyltransferase domain-containing protein [Streptomyces sp. NPDC091278]|uniref:methyltransferase domain-containing protein n=1 Tax=Streptomyces sp. NPDC091278 TaxID=3155301 RepID=UPI00344F4CC7
MSREPRVERLARRLADTVRATGEPGPGWERAFTAVQRHRYITPTYWVPLEGARGYERIVRSEQPDRWLDTIYTDTAIVTRIDRSRTDGDALHPSSSSSMPLVVARMLRHLDISDDDPVRVLEIGTGTGWNAALLCARLGSRSVVSVEIDPETTARARAALARDGRAPALLTGDGEKGAPDHAPFDRVISTCAVHEVPYPWVGQTAPGGTVVTPWGTAYSNSGLLKLTVRRDGTGHGRFVGTASFMWSLPQRPAPETFEREEGTHSTTGLLPELVRDYGHAQCAVGLMLPPGTSGRIAHGTGDASGEYTLWLFHPETGSWASVDHEPGATRHDVHQYGRYRLWDTAELAHRWWTDQGEPPRNRFGLTVMPHRQAVWLLDRHGNEVPVPGEGAG